MVPLARRMCWRESRCSHGPWCRSSPRSGPDLAHSGPLDTHSAIFVFASAEFRSRQPERSGTGWLTPRLLQGTRERRRADFVVVGAGDVSSTGSPTSMPGVKKSQRLGCAGRICGPAREGSGFLVRPTGFSGIEGTRVRGMPG